MSLSLFAHGQQNSFFVIEGTVKVEKDDATGATVRSMQNGQLREQIRLLKKGGFKIRLELNQEYILEFSKDGYYSKKILVSTEVPSYVTDRGDGVDAMLIEVSLFKEQETVSTFDLLDQAVGAIFFNQATQQFDNKVYLTPNHIKSKLKAMIAEVQKEIKNKSDGEDEDPNKRKDYERLIVEANKQFDKDMLQDAKSTYTKALDLYPNEVYPAMQIERINKKMQERLNQENILLDIESRYKAQIAIADKQFKQEAYAEAKISYTGALSIKKGDEYAISQIKECTRLGSLKDKENRYNEVISKADGYFGAERYSDAKELYKDALSIKPGAEYPINQIKKIDELLSSIAKKEQIEALYEQAMVEGSAHMVAEKYNAAIESFNKALELKVGDELATKRLKTARELLEAENIEGKYRQVLSEADTYYKKQLLPDALQKYKDAETIKPEEAYPKKRIAEILEILEVQKNLENLLTEAGNLFDANDYLQSKDKYQAVLAIEPAHTLSKARVKEIDKILAGQKENERYLGVVKIADQYFGSSQYENAITKYEEALTIKPLEEYPKGQINKAKAKLEKLEQEKENLEYQYSMLIAGADNAFGNKNYEVALQGYTDAGKLKPKEVYPPKRIAEIEGILASVARQKKLVGNADALFVEKKYKEAKNAYEAVLKEYPGHQYSVERIALIVSMLSERELELAYKGVIEKADKSFDLEDYESAIKYYNEALALKPKEVYPKRQISLAEAELKKQQGNKEKLEEFNQLIALGDAAVAKEEYESALSSYREAKSIIDNDFVNGKITDVLKIIEQRKELAQKQNEDSGVMADMTEQIILQEKYNVFINKANKLFYGKQYENALSNYNLALKLKPNEKYPADKIAEINEIITFLDQQKALAEAAKNEKPETYDYTREITPDDDGYDKLMEYGNGLYESDMYRSALKYYMAASKIRPSQKDCIAQISHVKTLVADLESKIVQMIAEGKQMLQEEEWERAISTFRIVKDIDPNDEKYSEYDAYISSAELGKMKDNINIAEVPENDCAALLMKGNAEKLNGNFIMSEYYLKKALALEPDNQDVMFAIKDLARARANENVDKAEQEYRKYINLADKAFVNNQLGVAKYYYNLALGAKENDAYSISRIKYVELQIEQNTASY